MPRPISVSEAAHNHYTDSEFARELREYVEKHGGQKWCRDNFLPDASLFVYRMKDYHDDGKQVFRGCWALMFLGEQFVSAFEFNPDMPGDLHAKGTYALKELLAYMQDVFTPEFHALAKRLQLEANARWDLNQRQQRQQRQQQKEI
jgi:hypothetical protein